jgi:hypothetical protein
MLQSFTSILYGTYIMNWSIGLHFSRWACRNEAEHKGFCT